MPLPDTSAGGNPSTSAIGGNLPPPSIGDIPGGNVPLNDPQTGNPYIGSPPEAQDQGSKPNTLPFDPSDPRDFSPTGPGSGQPTAGWISKIFGTAGNLAFPGAGMITGPLAKWAWNMYQNGASRAMVQNAVKAYQAKQGGGGDVTTGPPEDATGNPSGPGSNYNPFGGLPEGFTEGNRFGGGAPTFEGPGFTGPSWTPGGSIFGGRMNPNMNLAGSWTNLGASGGNLSGGIGNSIAANELNLYRKFGLAPGTNTPNYWGSGPPQLSPFMKGNPAFAQNISAPGSGAVIYGSGGAYNPSMATKGAGLPMKFAS